MAALATSVTQYNDSENQRTWSISGHTVAKPKLLLQKRKIGAIGGASSVDDLQVIYGTTDAAAVALPGRIVFEVTIKRPPEALSTDVTAALVVFRDVVASDEFTSLVSTQNYLKA